MEPCIEKLRDGDAESAWTAFLDRYRPVIWSTIRHYTTDGDDGAEIAAHVCAELSANDLAKLRAFAREPKPRATLATWLVAVVRNLTIDWVRHRDGRSRRHAPANLSPLQKRIYEHVFIEGRSHREAFELVQARDEARVSSRTFARELTAVHQSALAAGHFHRAPTTTDLSANPDHSTADHHVTTAEARARVDEVLETLPADTRLAIQLFVVEGMAAADVARTVGWSEPKAVYNKVYRALAAVRLRLETRGLRREDL